MTPDNEDRLEDGTEESAIMQTSFNSATSCSWHLRISDSGANHPLSLLTPEQASTRRPPQDRGIELFRGQMSNLVLETLHHSHPIIQPNE